MNAVNVADFDLLRDTQQDIRTLDWAQAANREGTVMYFGEVLSVPPVFHMDSQPNLPTS